MSTLIRDFVYFVSRVVSPRVSRFPLPLPGSGKAMRLRHCLGQGSLLVLALLVLIGGHVYRVKAQAVEKRGPEAAGAPTATYLEESLEPEEGLASPLEPRFPALPPTSTGRSGAFRVGNRTPYPIRLVILLRGGERRLNPETAHWDFAPGEGGSEGLVLSLGEEPLQIHPGDIVVAFTLDGSRRYWGPNVVGESLAPFWHGESGLWSMILQP